MTAAISSLGVGSGLDLSSLLTSLQTNEEEALTPITTKQTAENTKLTAYGTLTSALEAFNTASAALANPTLYTEQVASTNDAFTATVGTGATSGSYSINISQLAQAQSLVSGQTFSSISTQLGTTGAANRTLSIQVGTGAAVNVSLSDSQTSMSGLISAINGANAGVTASYVQSGDSGYQLVITSNASGASSNINMSVSGDDSLNAILGYSSSADVTSSTGTSTTATTGTGSGMSQTVAGQDALLTVNGVSIDRSSNTISNVPQGVTLTLNSTTSSTQNLNLRQSVTDADSAIDDWVSAYNSLLTTFNTLGQYTAVTAGQSQSSTNGPLLGDSVLDSVENQVKSALTTAQSSSTFQVLSQLGITQDATTGELSTNETTLVDNLTNNTSQVSAFFVGDGKSTGLATQMVNITNDFTGTSGVISGAEAGVNSVLTDLGKQYTQVQDKITSDIARYQTQFTNLDVLMSSLQQTSNFLTQQFDSSSSSSTSLGTSSSGSSTS
ncbi:flagellar filament capping protein FliD [Sodalis sp. dw_96]|uniref:flagellar filament capping protein FliD n=1 Tax=Sodalis sp. dw_96 TaxID=2719794 RepID=UPI001BD69C73|nr:flagellar filament capping protein FliD [Sodalis sp. dw_96]